MAVLTSVISALKTAFEWIPEPIRRYVGPSLLAVAVVLVLKFGVLDSMFNCGPSVGNPTDQHSTTTGSPKVDFSGTGDALSCTLKNQRKVEVCRQIQDACIKQFDSAKGE